jgi:hypothetical protein
MPSIYFLFANKESGNVREWFQQQATKEGSC